MKKKIYIQRNKNNDATFSSEIHPRICKSYGNVAKFIREKRKMQKMRFFLFSVNVKLIPFTETPPKNMLTIQKNHKSRTIVKLSKNYPKYLKE